MGNSGFMATDSTIKGYNGENLVTTLAFSFLIGASLFLQVTGTPIISRTTSKFDQIGQRTAELAAIERVEKSP